MLQRDAFITAITEAARKDRDVYFLSADFGAETLDTFREELPAQFVHCGISEQHMIDMAAGLALAGKKVYCYAMGPFFLRCYEQIKCCLSMMKQPVTLISTGVGLGYADSGPTHYLTEDIACMRALHNMEVFTPADTMSAWAMAEQGPSLRYIRLDREQQPHLYIKEGFDVARGFYELEYGEDVCIISSGHMLHRVLAAHDHLERQGVKTGVVDLFRLNPINFKDLSEILDRYIGIVTVEEQCLSGGFGSALLEAMSDNNVSKPVYRLGLPDRYYFENWGRNHLLDTFGLSVEDICIAAKNLVWDRTICA